MKARGAQLNMGSNSGEARPVAKHELTMQRTVDFRNVCVNDPCEGVPYSGTAVVR